MKSYLTFSGKPSKLWCTIAPNEIWEHNKANTKNGQVMKELTMNQRAEEMDNNPIYMVEGLPYRWLRRLWISAPNDWEFVRRCLPCGGISVYHPISMYREMEKWCISSRINVSWTQMTQESAEIGSTSDYMTNYGLLDNDLCVGFQTKTTCNCQWGSYHFWVDLPYYSSPRCTIFNYRHCPEK